MSLLAGGLLAVVPVKCNSILDRPGHPADDPAYEYVTVTGSSIPQRVPKGTKGTTAAPVATYDAAEFTKMTEKGQRQPKMTSGN